MKNEINLALCIDAGHGSDTRKNGGGKFSPITDMHEWEFNRAVADRLIQLCKEQGIKYIDVSPERTDTPLLMRTARANNFYRQHKDMRCVYVSLHANAGGGTGTEIWIHNKSVPSTIELASNTLNCICKATGQRNRGVKLGYVTSPKANFHVNRETDMVSMLIECGFMDSKEDCYKLLDDKFRQQCATATLEGICKHYGIELTNAELPKPDVLYRVQVGSFRNLKFAGNYLNEVKRDYPDSFIKREVINGKVLYKVQVGAFSKRKYAENYLREVQREYPQSFIQRVEV